MTTITLNVKDEYMTEFLEELKKFAKENNLTEKELSIFGLSVEKYEKIYKKDEDSE